MEVKVHLHGILRDHLPAEAKGRATINLEDGSTVEGLLKHLGIKRRVIITVNDGDETDAAQVLHDGDNVAVFTMIGGGQPTS